MMPRIDATLTMAPPPDSGNAGNGGARATHIGEEVHREHLLPALFRRLRHRLVPADPGVVDEHVEAAEALRRGLDEPDRRHFLAEVGFHEVHRRPLRRELRGYRHAAFGVAIGERDGGPVLDEAPHRRLPDPGGAPGHRDRLPRKPAHGPFSFALFTGRHHRP